MSENHYQTYEQVELDPFVMAIIPVQYGSKLYSKIIKFEEEIISPFRPLDIIKKGCRFYASSFSGRKEGTKELIGVTHKAPIVIDPLQSIYFFPTASPSQQHCYWLSHEHVQQFRGKGHTQTEVVFRNKQSIIIPISVGSFERQMLRTALLRTKVEQRLIENERKRQLLTQQLHLSLEAMERSSVYELFSDSSLAVSRLLSNRLNKK